MFMVICSVCNTVVVMGKESHPVDTYAELDALVGTLLGPIHGVKETLEPGSLTVASAFDLIEQELRALGVEFGYRPSGIVNTSHALIRGIDSAVGKLRGMPGLPQLPKFNIISGNLTRKIGGAMLYHDVDGVSATRVNVVLAEYSGSIETDHTLIEFDRTRAARVVELSASGDPTAIYTMLPGLRWLTSNPSRPPVKNGDTLEYLHSIMRGIRVE
jgi:hypothetical protein